MSLSRRTALALKAAIFGTAVAPMTFSGTNAYGEKVVEHDDGKPLAETLPQYEYKWVSVGYDWIKQPDGTIRVEQFKRTS